MNTRQRKLLRTRALEGRDPLSPSTSRVASRLGRAVHNGNFDYAQRLLQEGADPNDPGGFGSTPLVEAAGVGDVAMTRLLLDHGADVNAAADEAVTPLISAAYGGHAEAVRLLLDAGADATRRDESGYTALEWAQSCGYQEVALLLRRHEPRQ